MKTKSLLVLVVLFFCVSQLRADKLEKAFERLRIYDYFLAKQYFNETLKKKTPGAAYGLSIIFSTNNNPFYSLDSARKYILIADSAFNLLQVYDKTYYQQFGINNATIQHQRDSICIKAFREAEIISTVAQYNKYLQQYNFCHEIWDVVRLRNNVAFSEAKKLNTADAYNYFLTTYPKAADYNEALNHYQERQFAEATTDNSIASFAKFIQSNPESPYKSQAEKMIYTLSVKDKTVVAYHSFIQTYPYNKYVNEAWRELYSLYMKDFNETSFETFKFQFPDYPFKSELESDFKKHKAFYIPFNKENKWGYFDENGEVVIRPDYDEVNLFSENLAAVSKDGMFGFINKSNQIIIPFIYDEVEMFHNNSAVVSKDRKSGLISRSGEVLIPFVYDELSDAVDDICIAMLDEKSGYVTKENKKLTELMYDAAGDFKDGYAIVSVDEKYGLINQSGHTVIEPKYDQLYYFSENIFRVELNGKWGLVSNLGEIILPVQNDKISELHDNRALISNNTKFGYLDGKGKVVIPFANKYSDKMLETANFKNGYATFRQSNKSIIIDTLGFKLPLTQFDEIGNPASGLIPVRKQKKWGFADLSGKLFIPYTYDYAYSFENGFAKIKSSGYLGVIDSTGKIIVKPFWTNITQKNNLFMVSSNNHYGLLNRKGTQVFFTEFDRIEFLNDIIVCATKDEKRTYYNLLLNKIIW